MLASASFSTGTLNSPFSNSTSVNLSSEGSANLSDRRCCDPLNTFTTNTPDSPNESWLVVVFSMQINTSGGTKETEQNDETVIPCGRPDASFVVTTETPLANRESAFRNSDSETAIRSFENLSYRKTSCKNSRFDKTDAITDNLQAMTRMDEFLSAARRDVDGTLDALVPTADTEPVKLHQAIRWSLFAGGKRVRPALVFAAGVTFGADRGKLIKTAAAVEMIHTYSLIHDDLPAMDDDDLRRGKPTCHKQFGEATAILAGDVLQTLCFKTVAEDESLPSSIRLKLISLIAAAAGTPNGMVAGQQLDIDAEGKTLDRESIDRIHRGKTGAIISAAVIAGATIGGASDDELKALKVYGENLGSLFQITDDLLDVTQATETLGKTAGKDAVSEKATYAGLLGIDGALAAAQDVRRRASDALDAIRRDTHLLADIVEMIAERTR
jgi:geranylgeranyl diphosphate synthase, type II